MLGRSLQFTIINVYLELIKKLSKLNNNIIVKNKA